MSPERNELLPLQNAAPTIPSPASGRGLGRGQTLNNAKALRINQTEAEQRLWYHLRAHRFMELKFKRQKPMGRYIVDFVCVERRLIIELDGGQHQTEKAAYDQQRDAWLRGEGYTVLRFWNNDVMQNMEGVLEQIRSTLALSPAPLPNPLPPAGEGANEKGNCQFRRARGMSAGNCRRYHHTSPLSRLRERVRERELNHE